MRDEGETRFARDHATCILHVPLELNRRLYAEQNEFILAIYKSKEYI